ncbi:MULTISPECIES: hypothetical protein [Pseudomonas]|uniref:Uncharacterized protein n=1 Tax=Pseudomonas gingeri TaxID=117681 RepID=A0A7Y7WS08_9PSED|nr:MULTISPECIES: hypothetical protein [Pseudomonas]MPQ65547.1 hypothetical protein [Pseudomonas sp. MWU12-2323]NWB86200.1 hypothetical protein [Pseudomonas gingeri]
MHAVETSLIERIQEIFMGQAVLNNQLDPRSVEEMDESAGARTPAEPRYSGQMEPLAKHFETLANNTHHKMLALGRSVLLDKKASLQDREIEMLEDWLVDAELEAEVFAWVEDQPDGYSDGQVLVPLVNDIATPLGAVSYHEYA